MFFLVRPHVLSLLQPAFLMGGFITIAQPPNHVPGLPWHVICPLTRRATRHGFRHRSGTGTLMTGHTAAAG